MKITNNNDISLALSVWLLDDDYDYINESNYISVTRLMKPIRQIILGSRVESKDASADVEDFIARRLGHSLHDSIEKAWKKGYKRALKLLGYPDKVIDAVRINPEVVEPNTIPVYLEQRAIRELNGYKIGGKFDMVIEGHVEDTKSTSVYAWIFGTRDEDHILQGSMYRWLNPDKITEDFMLINYIFTDWKKLDAKRDPQNYPQKRVASKRLVLTSNKEIESWMSAKINLVAKYKNVDQSALPECTDEELWRSAPQYKYYSDPTKTLDDKSTKNFDNLKEANEFLAEKGKGKVLTKSGEVKRCAYCEAFDICTQKDKYFT